MRAVAGETGAEVTEDDPELVVVLGGDGTMLRAFHMYLGRGVPVIGVNFGRFGFLASMQPDELETGLRRVFSGDYVVIELPTLEFEHAGGRAVAVNDVVAATSEVGRVVGARVGDRRRAARDGARRRDHPRDAVGLDRVQPVEQRAGAHVGDRRDDRRRSSRRTRSSRGRSSSLAVATSS